MGNTFGTWLPGDPKGFRARHHREHVDGDYKYPPPKGKYDERWKRSKALMKRDPVYLTPAQRKRAVEEFVRSFKKWGIELRVLSIDRVHIHALARFPDHNPRHFVGLAKKESSAYIKRDGLAPDGGLWAVRCKCLPITASISTASSTTSVTTKRRVRRCGSGNEPPGRWTSYRTSHGLSSVLIPRDEFLQTDPAALGASALGIFLCARSLRALKIFA